MRSSVVKFALVAAAGLSLAACEHSRNSLGLAQVRSDDYRVVTKAPLVIPPDYAMRPSAPGEPRPQELQPESAGRQALYNERNSEQRSVGEKLLVQRAGADHADPLARYVVDDEFGDIAYKEKAFSDKVMAWRKEGAQPGAAQGEPIDVAAEQQRLKALTGGKPVIIAKKSDDKLKFPHL